MQCNQIKFFLAINPQWFHFVFERNRIMFLYFINIKLCNYVIIKIDGSLSWSKKFHKIIFLFVGNESCLYYYKLFSIPCIIYIFSLTKLGNRFQGHVESPIKQTMSAQNKRKTSKFFRNKTTYNKTTSSLCILRHCNTLLIELR